MIIAHQLEKKVLLKGLYMVQEKWCTTFSLDIFSIKIKYTQRSESTNIVFHKLILTAMPLRQVIQYYDDEAEKMRHDEINKNFQCKNGALAKAAELGGLRISCS